MATDGAAGESASRVRASVYKAAFQPIPYANMTYAALERRLETAVFRAMFASSTRQARQFCIHGAVKVNGKKVGVLAVVIPVGELVPDPRQMIYPGYNLNPGDLFQVEPEQVLFATGATKDRMQRRQGRLRKRETAEPSASEKRAKADLDDGPDAGNASDESALDSRATLQKLLATSRTLADSEKDISAAKRKRALRSFTKLVRKTLSQTGTDRAPATSAKDQLRELMATLNISVEDNPAARPSNSSEPSSSADSTSAGRAVRSVVPLTQTQTVRSHQQKQLQAALQEARENPFDPAKPYATPWRPRPFMSAFACVPRYLEVHPSICAAVYLRHPVARPGLAEVPTPFDAEMMALAHNWYLRRR